MGMMKKVIIAGALGGVVLMVWKLVGLVAAWCIGPDGPTMHRHPTSLARNGANSSRLMDLILAYYAKEWSCHTRLGGNHEEAAHTDSTGAVVCTQPVDHLVFDYTTVTTGAGDRCNCVYTMVGGQH
jgi:hypothetical protein